jgi:hypothetical protein
MTAGPKMSERLIPWTDDFREFFRMAGETWRAPAVLRSRLNARRTRLTVEAVFRQADGSTVRAVTKMAPSKDGWEVIDERLVVRAVFRPVGDQS